MGGIWSYKLYFFVFFVGFGGDNNFTEFINMGYLVLVEADVVYVCKVYY